MANNFLNSTGLSYLWGRITNIFATKTALQTLDNKVDTIINEGGEPNTIETISVNGTPQTPDANKNVALTMPTKVSDLTNDGDGTSGSRFATEAYVGQNGGKIDKIKVNNVEQSIASADKSVNITVPTNVSDLTNDSGFQTASQVATAISAAVASAYKYKGSVATYANLPASGNEVGDMWDVQENGANYAWTGTAWDAMGQIVDTSLLWSKSELTAITTAQIDAIVDA
jgi:hypothetical protein